MKRLSKICLFLILFIMGIANISAATKDYHATAKNANKELKHAYGETAARYCYYTQDGEPADYYDIIIAVSKNNRYAAGDIATTLASNREIVENWTPTDGCPQYAVDETVVKNYLFIPVAETTLYVTDTPTRYYENADATVYKLVTITPHSADDKEHKMTCSYTMTNLSESIDGSKVTIKFNNMNKVYEYNTWDGKVFFNLSDEFLTETNAIDDSCPKLKMCYNSEFKSGTNSDLVSIYFSINPGDYKPNECKIMTCTNDEDAECDPENSEAICPGFKFIQDRDLTDEQKDEQLTDFCSDVLSTFNYSNTCAQKCMNYLENNKKPIDVKNPNCGITQRLFDWIMNILNWVKYIVPVLLIVLSMLDFIKALAGEKEDDMKKAQKHFVIRLIAAVLIFLTPFILEFIFDKMGFVYEGCGIFK